MKRLLIVTFRFFFPFARGRNLDLLGYGLIFLLLLFPIGGWRLVFSEEQFGEKDRVYGNVYKVPEFMWTKVRNWGGVKTSNVTIRQYENCLIRYQGQVTEIINQSTWWSSISDRVLVEYTTPGNTETTGVLCPSGTIFFLLREVLISFPDKYRERKEFEFQLIEEVSELLQTRQPGTEVEVSDFFTWVEIVNPGGVENFGYKVGFLDACGIEALGRMEEIGNTFQGAVYEYTPDPRRGFLGIGIPCPARTLFLLDSGQSISKLDTQQPSA